MARRFTQPDNNVDREFREVDQRLTQLENSVNPPVGSIFLWSGENSPPIKYLVCDGRTLPRALYPALFNVLQRRSGETVEPDISTNFALPDISMTINGTDFPYIIKALP